MINQIIQYFDLQSAYRGPAAQAGGPKKYVFPQYVIFTLGIFIQPYLASYQSTGNINVDGIHFIKHVLFSFIIAIVLFPKAYKKIKKISAIGFVDLCAIFTSGVTWQSVMGVAQKAALGM
jgi:uncharacterized membrane protein YagU involved in acid resistance